jgi:glycogen debranching enzyme
VTTLALKSGYCYAHLDASAATSRDLPRVMGLFLRDTRHLSDYAWNLAGFDLSEQATTNTTATQFWSRFVRHSQTVLLRRVFVLRPDGFDDVLTLTNEALDAQEVALRLTAAADFVDAFELRGRVREIGRNPVHETVDAAGQRMTYVAQDGVTCATMLTFDGFANGAVLTLAPGERRVCRVTGRFSSSLAGTEGDGRPIQLTPAADALRQRARPGLRQAFADIDTLACHDTGGPWLAAGVPNYVTLFGRDSLIAAWFLLDAAPEVAVGTLRAVADLQGRTDNPGTQEEPGKILHETRQGELARTGDVPFRRYYGTTDATALFLILLADYTRRSGDPTLADDLRQNALAALDWVRRSRDPVDGLVRYPASRTGKGLYNTSWKDSDDSIFHPDGRIATGRVAVVEIQGYTVAALRAAADLGLDDPAGLRADADAMAATIDRLFWSDTLGLHAIALTPDGARVETGTSNPGHLLWAGCLTHARAVQVADRLMQPDMWSGWGLRSASTDAARYQPLSYHNGSVWPHDTGLFAAGLARYGLDSHLATVAGAMMDLADRQPGHQLPELLGGYARDGDTPPLIYIETCRPQAWAAAALIWAGMALRDA